MPTRRAAALPSPTLHRRRRLCSLTLTLVGTFTSQEWADATHQGSSSQTGRCLNMYHKCHSLSCRKRDRPLKDSPRDGNPAQGWGLGGGLMSRGPVINQGKFVRSTHDRLPSRGPCALSGTVATDHMWLWSTCSVASVKNLVFIHF